MNARDVVDGAVDNQEYTLDALEWNAILEYVRLGREVLATHTASFGATITTERNRHAVEEP